MLTSTPKRKAPRYYAHGPTLYRIGPNRYRLMCDMCGELCFVDASSFRRASCAILEGLDNPFLCPLCDREGEDVWRFAE